MINTDTETSLAKIGIRFFFASSAMLLLSKDSSPTQAVSIAYLLLHILIAFRQYKIPPSHHSYLPTVLDIIGASAITAWIISPPIILLHATLALCIPAALDSTARRGLLLSCSLLSAITLLLLAQAPLTAIHAVPWGLAVISIYSIRKFTESIQESVPGTAPLTGIHNKASLTASMHFFSAYRKRNHNPASFIMIRLILNERFSFCTTNTLSAFCQRELAQLLERRLRACDVIAHYDHHRFAILLPDADLAGASVVIKDILEAFDDWNMQKALKARLQVGVANLPSRPMAIEKIASGITQHLDNAERQNQPFKNPVFVDLERIMEPLPNHS